MKPAIVIHSCDKYNYILGDFFKHFKKWPEFYNYNIYLTTEKLPYQENNVVNIMTGDFSWSKRLAIALEQICETDFILFQEDFFVTYFDPLFLEKAILLHHKYDCDITKLASFHEFNLTEIHDSVENLPVYEQRGGTYIMSHQPPAIFKKQFMLKTLYEALDPWQHECQISDEIKADKYGDVRVLTVGNIHRPNKSEIITIHHAMRKGQYYPC